ncbi:hypothetical protein, partial [Nostoc sp.]|uniref:hypothetical protein n=1 Tax=Nostoc sp. TaxID=1180 RepID=UPI002FFA050B
VTGVRTTVAVWVSWLRVFERQVNLALIIGFICWWQWERLGKADEVRSLIRHVVYKRENLMPSCDLNEDDVVSANLEESFGVGSTFKLSELMNAVPW